MSEFGTGEFGDGFIT